MRDDFCSIYYSFKFQVGITEDRDAARRSQKMPRISTTHHPGTMMKRLQVTAVAAAAKLAAEAWYVEMSLTSKKKKEVLLCCWPIFKKS